MTCQKTKGTCWYTSSYLSTQAMPSSAGLSTGMGKQGKTLELMKHPCNRGIQCTVPERQPAADQQL